jgi:hypothetical protein
MWVYRNVSHHVSRLAIISRDVMAGFPIDEAKHQTKQKADWA